MVKGGKTQVKRKETKFAATSSSQCPRDALSYLEACK
jgi:hypothetical protein